MELTPEEHADSQCRIQRWIDSSISKTVNAPKGYSVRQVQNFTLDYTMVELKVALFMLMAQEIARY